MWRDDTFSQRSKAKKRAAERRRLDDIQKMREVGNIGGGGGYYKIGGLGTLCQLYRVRIKFITQNDFLIQ